MLWLTWRQHRWQLIGLTAVLCLYASYLIDTGIRIRHALSPCPSSFRTPPPELCLAGIDVINDIGNTLGEVVVFGNLLPLAVGMFWGAPLLAREFEQGTYRLAFTQSVSRRRWLATKLGALTTAAAILGAINGAGVDWTYAGLTGPFAQPPFGNTGTFQQSGLVPAATWVFALFVGVTLGLLLRHTTAAVAVTLVLLPLVFAGLVFIRPHYLPPVERVVGSADLVPDPFISNSPEGWLFQVSYVDSKGRELTSRAAGEICADPASTYPTEDCLSRTGLRQRIVYQPANRYLWFQLIESGLLLTASAGMALFIWRRITDPLRRTTGRPATRCAAGTAPPQSAPRRRLRQVARAITSRELAMCNVWAVGGCRGPGQRSRQPANAVMRMDTRTPGSSTPSLAT